MITLLRSGFNTLHCLISGHPGVFREWEWQASHPQWKEREDMWTCIRCGKELLTIPDNATSYIVARPHMDGTIIDYVNHAIEQHGTDRVRIRAGDPITRKPRI